MTTLEKAVAAIVLVASVLCIGLKLIGAVAWPWIWVLAPLWLSAACIAAALSVIFLVEMFDRNK